MKVGKTYKSNHLPLIGECIDINEESDILSFRSITGPWIYFIPDGKETYSFRLSKDKDKWTEFKE